VPYSIAVSKLRPAPSGTGLRGPFLFTFFIAVRLLRRREQFTEPDFALLARAFNRLGMGLWPTDKNESHSRCHPRESEGPRRASRWIPAPPLSRRTSSAGMTGVGARRRLAPTVGSRLRGNDEREVTFNRAQALYRSYPTAWVFLPDPAGAGHCICAPVQSRIFRLTRTSHNEKTGCAQR
jgi:hypothetical protein